MGITVGFKELKMSFVLPRQRAALTLPALISKSLGLLRHDLNQN